MPPLGQKEQEYLKAGGTLSNFSIPTLKSEEVGGIPSPFINPNFSGVTTGGEYAKGAPSVVTSSAGRKAIEEALADTNRNAVTKPTEPIKPERITAEETLLSRELEAGKTAAEKEADSAKATFQSLIDPIKASIDASRKAQISLIENQYSQLRAATEKENARRTKLQETIGIRFGGRYSPEHTADLVTDKVNEGLQRIQQLNSEEQAKINAINSAADEKAYSLAMKQYDALVDIRKEKDKKLAEIEKTQLDGLKKIKEQEVKGKKDATIAEIYAKDPSLGLFDLFSKASSVDSTITSKDVKDFIDNTKTDTEKITGDYGEYLNYKKENPSYSKDFFSYLKDKKQAVVTDEDVSGVITGNIERDAETIMSGSSPLRLSDLSTKGNYRAKVAESLNKKKAEALRLGDIIGVIRASAGGKDPDATFLQSFEKGLNVVSQIASLQESFTNGDDYTNPETGQKINTDEETGPIWGIIRSANPYDTKAQQIKAQLTSIVPNLARGIYGEVGVLTDNDIALYSKTLPTLTSTPDVREAVLGITLRSVQRSLENKLKTQAGFGRDVSGIESVYKEVKALADKILAPLEAKNIKSELDNVPITPPQSSESPTDFWSNAK